MNGDGSGRSRDHYDRRDRRDRGDRGDRGDRERDRDRRRSRSPRRRDHETDSYSSSRNHRERDRIERYGRSGRDDERGGERGGSGWPRDRGGDREPDRRRDPRGEERRPQPREDGRRGGGDDRPRRRDGGGFGKEQRRSASPPPRKKEPTPDLTDVVSVLERKRRLTQWDIKPQGYENVTAEQAKLSGMFPLPGAPRAQGQAAPDPSRLQAIINQPAVSTDTSTLKPAHARQSKRLFVYNLPASTTEDALAEFFNLQLNGLNVIEQINPCISAQISREKGFAMLEFRNPEDATVALAMDGIAMEADDESNGHANGRPKGLKIQRPQDYIAPTAPDDAAAADSVIFNRVVDSPNKISISHIPLYLGDEEVLELLKAFGELKSFVLVKDTGSEQSRGIAFCEYANPDASKAVLEGLRDIDFGGQHMRVQLASVGIQQVSGLESGINAMSMLAGTESTDLHEGRVLQLLNMVTAEELMDNDEYEEICEDVREECEKYGRVEDLKIPRPSGSRVNPGVGKIFVKFDGDGSARKAMKALAGRKFADRTVVVTYFGEEYFDVNAW